MRNADDAAIRGMLDVLTYGLRAWTNDQLYIDRYYREFLNWLAKTNYGTQQANLIGKREEGTGQWFLKSSDFFAWLQRPTRTLLCQGIPGAGKTLLTAIVVNDLRERFWCRDDVGVAVAYCSYSMREEQTKETLLAGLLRQLVKHKHSELEHVQALYKNCKNVGRRPSFSELSRLLRNVARSYSTTFIVLNALDECDDTV